MNKAYSSLLAFAALLAAFSPAPAETNAAQITVNKRSRVENAGAYRVQETTESWLPGQTAIIVCDMWDSHHCLNAVRRCVEVAPRMNQVLNKARDQGVLIIHAPSSCMEAYQTHPGRKLALGAPQASNLPTDISQWCRLIPSEEKGIYPIDQTKGGEDDDLAEHKLWQDKLAALGRNPKSPWKSQIALLTIADKDPISDSGVEIWNLLESRGIKNVVLLGVHTNMCVLGRPFGLRQMAKNGKNVVLMRDLTDTMYDPSQWPYVNHFTGTHLIVEHIEKFVCPTITSVSFLGGEPFRFSRDRRKLTILIGDDEYKTEISLPAFVKSDLAPLGFDVTIIHADSQDKNSFPGMAEAIKWADVVLVSARRRLPPKADLDALREHIAAGKPVLGIRTACHAWCLRTEKENAAAAAAGRGVWPKFDPEVFGGHYTNHYGNGPKTTIMAADGAKDHAILRGIDAGKVLGNGSLYKVNPLTATTTPLLFGSIPAQEPEPVAWTNAAGPKKARVFNTTLGHLDDFENPAFRKLLTSALFWSLEEPYPTGQDIEKLLPSATK
jgi:nicotinamidase-related amidase